MKKQNYLKGLLAFLLLMVGANASWADDPVTITLTPSKDGYVRSGANAGKNYNANTNGANGMINASDLSKLSTETDATFIGLLGFDLSSVKAKIDDGYAISRVSLRLTNASDATATVSVFSFADNSWSESAVTWNSSNYSTNMGTSALGTLTMVKGYNNKKIFEAASGSSATTSPLDIATYQSTLTSTSDSNADFFNAVVNAIDNSAVSFALTASAEQSIFSKDISETIWSAINVQDYEWDGTNNKWNANGSETINRFAAVKKYFGLTDENAATTLCPQLIIEFEVDPNVTLYNPTADTYVRSDSQGSSYGSTKTFEIKNGTDLFYGLMSFVVPIPNEGTEIEEATLRLTTRVPRGSDKTTGIYDLNTTISESTTYTSVSDAITSAIAKDPVVTFTLQGQNNKAITDSGLDDANKVVSAWQQRIDLTDYMNGLNNNTFAFLIQKTSGGETASSVIFTKEATDETWNGGGTISATDLKPRLRVKLKTNSTDYNVATNVTNGEITIDKSSSKVNGLVKITAVTPSASYSLRDGSLKATYGTNSEVKLIDNGDGTYSFYMPSADVTVTATFDQLHFAQKIITVKDQPNDNGYTVAYADNSKTVAYTSVNNSVWYLGDVDLSKVYSIEVKGAAFVSNGTTKAQLKLAYLASASSISKVSTSTINSNNATIRDGSHNLAVIEAETTPTTMASGKNATNYPGADFIVKPSGVTLVDGYAGTATLGTSTGISKTDGVYQLFLYGTASSRRLAVDQVIINYSVDNEGDPIPDGAYTDKTLTTAYYGDTGYETLAAALTAVGETSPATVSVSGAIDEDFTIAAGKSITIEKDAAATSATLSGAATVNGTLTLSGVSMTGSITLASTASLVATNMAAPTAAIPVTISGEVSTSTTYITGGTTANFVLMNNGYEFVADGTNLKVQTVSTTAKTLVVKDRVNVNGSKRTITASSKEVAATNSDNSIWYLGDVDMTKVYSITVEGAAFVSNGDNKAQLRLAFLPANTISSITTDALSTNSSTIRNAANLMAQIVAQTTPTTVETGKDATNYAGANFIITTAGVSQTGAYDGAVVIDATNSKGLQKTDATYQLFLYGNASSRRLAVDKVIINFRGTEIPAGAYVDNILLAHPAMLHTQADIDRVRGNLGLSPIREAYSHLETSSYAQTSYTASPVQYLKRMDQTNWSGTYPDYNNYTNAMKDANAAYQLALRYQLSGDQTYAAKAAAILDAWATTNQGVLKLTGYTNDIPDPNEYLICIQGHQFANAAELLNGYTWSGKPAFVNWMKTTFYDLAHTFLTTHHDHPTDKHYWMNWDLAAMTAILSYGILADDQTKVTEALDYYKDATSVQTGALKNAIVAVHNDPDISGKKLGQCQESGRDQGHSTLDVALLGAFCQMATNVSGEDYFAMSNAAGGNALNMAEYVARYNLGKDVPYTAYNANTTEDDHQMPTISAVGRGNVRPIWEMYLAYAKSKGADATYTQQWVNQLRAANVWGDGGAGDYGTDSNGFDQLGYGTLMYAEPDVVAKIGTTEYTSWKAAVAAATDNDVIELQANIIINPTTTGADNSRTKFTKNVTVKSAAGQTYTIKRDNGVTSTALFSANTGKTVTFQDLIFDDNSATAGILFEINNNTFNLNNVTIKNSKSTSTEGVIGVKNNTNSHLNLTNVTFDNCAVSAGMVTTHLAGTDAANLTVNGLTLNSCIGGMFNLPSGATLDASQLTIASTITYGIADATPTITNVTDQSKFSLLTDGYVVNYSSNTITFTEDGNGQAAEIKDSDYPGKTISRRNSQGDTYVRSDNENSKNGSAAQVELRTNADGSNDFVSMMSFRLPNAAVGNVVKAQLKLVTKRVKTNNRVAVHAFGAFDEKEATYATMNSAIAAARATTRLAKFKPSGLYDKDCTSDVTTMDDANKNLAAWTNYVDLTSYVQGLTGKDVDVNLMLSEATGDGKAIQFFTKECKDMNTSDGKAAFNAGASELMPQLVVVYTDDASTRKTFYIAGEGSYDTLDEAIEAAQDGDVITVTKNATISSRATFTKNLTLKAESGVVLTRGSEETAMKQSVLFKANSGKTVTFDGITFDDNQATVGQLIEVDNNTFVLKNMTVKNSKSSSANGVVSMKKGTLTVEGITFTDCGITNAYLRAAAGTLNFSGNYTLNGSTGNHFRLGDLELNAATLPAIDGTWRIEVESEAAKITNVSDQNKFSLETIGYTMHYANNTLTFTEDGDGQDTSEIVVPDGCVKKVVTASLDTYVRKGDSSDNGKKSNMEVYTFSDGETDVDFVGLMAFRLPDDLTKQGAKLEKAQLRLVTKRVKGSRIIDMYQLFTDFSESATYDQMESRIDEARDNGRMHRFKARGMNNMDIEADSLKLTDEYKNIELWTNKIDLTSTVANVMLDDGILRFALSAAENANNAKQFFTKEAQTIKNAVMTVSDEYLIPELTLVYTPGSGASALTAKTVETEANMDLFLRKGSTADNSISECIEVYTFKDDTKDQDFVGLLSFNLTDEVAAARNYIRSRATTRAVDDDLVMFNATLRLVTKRLKGERDMNVFIFDEPFNNKSAYAELESAIADARANNAYVTFKTAGMADKDVTSDAGLSGDYGKSISAWTNTIDVTDLVKNSDAKTLNVMLSAPNNERSPKQYFSSEADSFTNNNYTSFIVSSEDLVPLLTVTYRNPLYTDIEERITIPVNEDNIIYDLRGNCVQSAGKGIYIINGKKVLKK